MAEVTIKLFGVLRVDTHLANEKIEAKRLIDIFALLNERSEALYQERAVRHPGAPRPPVLSFSDTIVYVNGNKCGKKKQVLHDGDEIWILSPASGG